MSEYAPQAIHDLFNAIQSHITSAQLSGILGDASHTYGYHRARAVLPSSDYSVVLSPDQGGDGWAASALDISLPPDQMIACTSRLLAAAKAHDPRLAAVREFCGTTDGNVTHSYDLSNGHEGFGEWDSSHLWHIHLSIYRVDANNFAALAPIADVFAGVAGSEEVMATAAEVAAAVWGYPFKNPQAGTVASAQQRLFSEVGSHAYNADHKIDDLEAKLADVEAKLDRLIAKLGA